MLYEDIAKKIAVLIDRGTYKPGERLPGVRKLAEQFSVSVSTVVLAQQILEEQGRIEARPRSGYYISALKPIPIDDGGVDQQPKKPNLVSGQSLVLRIIQASNRANVIQLGAAVPHHQFLPVKALHSATIAALRKRGGGISDYEFPPGNFELRRAISKRMQMAGCVVDPAHIVITSGCQEALMLALRSLTKPGDIVAIESPCFYGLLQVIETLGLKALEIPTHPKSGISIDALKLAFEQWPVKVCVVVPAHSNPLGYCMNDDEKRALVDIAQQYQVRLIENDIYGDLGFESPRSRAVKSFDKNDTVIYCSSFSKTISPGLRIGWIVAHPWQDQLEYLKYVSNLAATSVSQLAVAEMLSKGGYERYLRVVRTQYHRQVQTMAHAIHRYFPEGTRISQPKGGFVLWVELPSEVDAMVLYQNAVAQDISIAPGPIFSANQTKYRNHIRISCAQPWDNRLEKAISALGVMAKFQIDKRH